MPQVRPTVAALAPCELGKDGQPSMPWGNEILLCHTEHYTLKRMFMRAGASGPLQFHENKEESFVVESGRVEVTFDDGTGRLVQAICEPGQGFHIPPGAVHKVTALAPTVMYEASTPHFDDRVAAAHLYPNYAEV